MPTDPLPADRRRIQKWIDTAQALRDQQGQRYVCYEVTRIGAASEPANELRPHKTPPF